MIFFLTHTKKGYPSFTHARIIAIMMALFPLIEISV